MLADSAKHHFLVLLSRVILMIRTLAHGPVSISVHTFDQTWSQGFQNREGCMAYQTTLYSGCLSILDASLFLAVDLTFLKDVLF